MATQPWQQRQAGPPETPYLTVTNSTTDNTSEKTVEMDISRPPVFARDSNPSPYPTRTRLVPVDKPNHAEPDMSAVPSYMATTQSAKAKVRSESCGKQRVPQGGGSQWNSSTRWAAPAVDSSSSGGGTAAYQAPRSPAPKISAGSRARAHRLNGYSPDSSGGGDDWTSPISGYGWRRNDY